MKSRFELYEEKSNNWLRIHGYAMERFSGKRKRITYSERADLPFSDYKDLQKIRKRKHRKSYKIFEHEARLIGNRFDNPELMEGMKYER